MTKSKDRKGGEQAKILMQQQLRQLKEQLPRLDEMIQQAMTAKDLGRFQTWKRQLIRTLRKEGINVPKTPTQNTCEHKRWMLVGKTQTCRSCGFKRPQHGRLAFKVTAAHRARVTAYIMQRRDQPREAWHLFAKAIGISGTNLGAVVSAMKEAGLISEPDGKGSMRYIVVPAKGRAAAKKLYTQQRAEKSPKASIVPAAKLEEKRAAKARRSAKVA